jgi:hypothetical protein
MASGAEFAAIDRVLRIAFEFLRQPHLDDSGAAIAHNFSIAFHYTNHGAAARRAECAHARLPGGHSGDEIFLGNETDELLLGAAAAL